MELFVGETEDTYESVLDKLTKHEYEIVMLMLKNTQFSEIAAKFDMDKKAIKYYKRSIYRKLEIHSKAELFRMVQK